jgi:hypothetical protein
LQADKNVRDAADTLDEQRAAAATVHAEISHAEKRLAATRASVDKLTAEGKKQQKDKDTMQRDLAAVARAIDALAARDETPELQLTASQMKEYREHQDEAGRATHEQRTR